MYISLWENYRGHPDNIRFMQFSTKIDGFEQKYSQGFENSYNSYEQYPLEKFFVFTIYQKLYFGFNPILTGLFESKFLLLQIFCMDVKTHLKSIATNFFLPKTVYLLYYYNLCK